MTKCDNFDPKGAAGALKDPLHLIPAAGTRPTARVLRLGAEKYGQWNFRENQLFLHTYIGAMKRHIEEFWDEGLDKDEESGEHPLAHVIASAMIVLDAIKHGTLIDNRWKPASQ